MEFKRFVSFAFACAFIYLVGAEVCALTYGISDVLNFLGTVDTTKYTAYTEQEWETDLTAADRLAQLNYVITDQGGTSYLTESDVSDASTSYAMYESVSGINSIGPKSGQSIYTKIIMEKAGQADYGLGFYNDNGHSGGGFAATLDEEFVDYLQNNYTNSNNIFVFSNGYYVSWESVLWKSAANHSVDGVTHKQKWYGMKFYLHDVDGTIINTANYYNHTDWITCICEGCNQVPYDGGLALDSDGYVHFIRCANQWNHAGSAGFDEISQKLPWYDTYGLPSTLEDGLPASAVDDSGKSIDVKINSDNVIYGDNTYSYDYSDHSVTIDGIKYYLNINPTNIDEDYYTEFLDYVVNKYTNYYVTETTEFDDSDIIKAVQSVYNSLDLFRTNAEYCLKNVKSDVADIRTYVRTLLSNVKTMNDRLETIIDVLKSINGNVEELTDEQKEKSQEGWTELIELFKSKLDWTDVTASVDNIQTAFFGTRTYSTDDGGNLTVVIASADGSSISSSMPSLGIEYGGKTYPLYGCVSYLGSEIETIKTFISVFLWAAFGLGVYRSIPSILGGVSAVVSRGKNSGG